MGIDLFIFLFYFLKINKYIFEGVIFNSRKGRSPRHLTQVMGFVLFDLKLIVLTLNCQTLYSAGNYRLYYT